MNQCLMVALLFAAKSLSFRMLNQHKPMPLRANNAWNRLFMCRENKTISIKSETSPKKDANRNRSDSHLMKENDGKIAISNKNGMKDSKELVESEGLSVPTARALMVTASALYGTNFATVKLLEDSMEPPVAAALRFSIAAISFLPFLRGINKRCLLAGAEIGFWNAIGYFAQSISLTTTTASKSAFICSLAVIFVPALDQIFSKNSENKSSWAPALLAVVGVACLELGGLEPPVIGDLWAAVQPLAFGMGFWRMEKLSRENPDDSSQLTAMQLVSVAFLSILWCSFSHSDYSSITSTIFNDKVVLLGLVWTGLVTTALTLNMETTALKKISAAESTVILSTEPIWGTAFAVVLLGEHAGFNSLIGAFLILIACLWGSLPENFLNAAAASGIVGIIAIIENALVNLEILIASVAEIISNL